MWEGVPATRNFLARGMGFRIAGIQSETPSEACATWSSRVARTVTDITALAEGEGCNACRRGATLLLHLAHAALGVSDCMPTILNSVARAWKFRGAA